MAAALLVIAGLAAGGAGGGVAGGAAGAAFSGAGAFSVVFCPQPISVTPIAANMVVTRNICLVFMVIWILLKVRFSLFQWRRFVRDCVKRP